MYPRQHNRTGAPYLGFVAERFPRGCSLFPRGRRNLSRRWAPGDLSHAGEEERGKARDRVITSSGRTMRLQPRCRGDKGCWVLGARPRISRPRSGRSNDTKTRKRLFAEFPPLLSGLIIAMAGHVDEPADTRTRVTQRAARFMNAHGAFAYSREISFLIPGETFSLVNYTVNAPTDCRTDDRCTRHVISHVYLDREQLPAIASSREAALKTPIGSFFTRDPYIRIKRSRRLSHEILPRVDAARRRWSVTRVLEVALAPQEDFEQPHEEHEGRAAACRGQSGS